MSATTFRIRILTGAAVFAATALLVPSFASAGDAAAGKATYEANCLSCHGTTGKGDGPVGAVLQPPPRDFSKGDFKFDANGNGTPGEDDDLLLVVKKGAGEYGGNQMMAPWGGVLSDDDISNTVAYVRTLKE